MLNISSSGRALAVVLSLLVASFVLAEKPDTSRRPWTTSRIAGTPEPPEPYKLVSAFPKIKFERPTSIEQVPGANRLLVTEMGGKIYTIEKQSGSASAELLVDLRELLPKEFAGQSISLFDADFHPQFKSNHYLFVCYVHPDKGRHTRVSRLTLTGDSPPKLVAGSEQVIVTWPTGGHNAGCLEFGKDGMLYISTGDGSGPNPPDGLTTGQTVDDLLGAILRIDVDHPTDKQNYTVPSDNPFVGTKDARPEIWAYGLRNPWKFGTDPNTGDIFAADNGWESWEMVHRIVRGGNCGWPVMEGRVALRSEVKPGPTPILPPVKDHPHTEANSVIGGPVYRGKKLAELDGSFVYGDYITGTIWSIRREKDDSYSFRTLCDTDERIVAFTQGSEGELYVLDYDFTGQIYELVPSGLKDLSAKFPRRLSETGLFEALHIVTPAQGVVPYTVQVERWMDGATAQRFIAIPDRGQVKLSVSKDEPPVFPEGTVLVKHISLPQGDDPPIRLETQLLHFENGVWHPYSYLWDEYGRDATLVESIGKNRTLQVGKEKVERTWHVNAVNECKLCHNAESGYVLGFKPNQLTRSVPGSVGADELTALYSIKAIAEWIRVKEDDPLRLVDPHDTKQKLDDRARSYLHVNCSMCHQPGGNAIVSFFLRRDLPFDKLNTNKGTGIGTFGMRDAKIIVPGDPYRSVLMYRFAKLGYARMPYIGSQVVDSKGVALIEEWIRSMPGSGVVSGPATEGSDDSTALRSLMNPTRKKQAVEQLVKSTEGSLALVALLHRDTLPGDVREQAIAAGSAAKSDIRGLFDTFIPEAKRRPTLGTTVDPKVVLDKQGDLQRGKLIFFSDNARCRNCHEVEDRAASLGPTLQEINKKYPKLADMLQHVLQPSLKVDDPFAGYNVVTNDGKLYQGLMVEETDKEVTLKTIDKKIVRIPRTEIEELKKSTLSLMPDKILSDLTAQEAADLLEYLRSVGSAK